MVDSTNYFYGHLWLPVINRIASMLYAYAQQQYIKCLSLQTLSNISLAVAFDFINKRVP